MIDALIDDGDVVIIKPSNTVNNGETVVAWLKEEEETTLKKFYIEGSQVRLQPANTTMDPIFTSVLIKKFISNKYKTKVIPCKTVRNSKGLALSSRNYLLNKNEKKIGSKIYKLLKKSKFCLKKSKSKSIFLKKIQNKIINFGVRKIEYLKLIDLKTNSEITKKTKKYNIFISYYFRNIRLIDNV